MAEMKSAAASLLDLPPEIKRRNTDVIHGSGYEAPSETNPLYEGLGLYDVGDYKAVTEFCTLLGDSPPQREIFSKYSKAVHELAVDMGNKIAESMGVTVNLLEEWPCQFQINKYSFCEESVGSSGVYVHTDSGFLTILQDDDKVSSLEVVNKMNGEYVAVDLLPNSFLVNLGDIATVTIEVPYLFVQTLLYVVFTYPMIGYHILQIPRWWKWLYYLVSSSWTLNAMLTSQYGDSEKTILVFGEKKIAAAFLRDYFGWEVAWDYSEVDIYSV